MLSTSEGLEEDEGIEDEDIDDDLMSHENEGIEARASWCGW